MAAVGLVVAVGLNVLMLHYHYGLWTNPKVGFWTAFWSKFEISGFDPFTYIIISKWRPLYVLARHPLLALMMWPLSALNGWLTALLHLNCAIFVVAVVWTLLALASWMLMFGLMRRAVGLSFFSSAVLTAWFFSFSHIMLVVFTPDHMAVSLPLLLLTLWWAARAVERGRPMPLWQSLPLLFVATGVTTTNMVKVAVADFFTQWGRRPWCRVVLHFLLYLLPLAVIGVLYVVQQRTTERQERQHNERLMQRKAARNRRFAAEWQQSKKATAERHKQQIIDLSIVTSTEHHIDRLPSLVENIFGEGLLLHDDYALRDANKQRPALVTYRHWWYYALEACTVVLFLCGVWCGRRQRLLWITVSMFLFDMLLHVGLQFANADAYIMTAHWAFVIPVAVACLLKTTSRRFPRVYAAVQCTVLFLCLFQWVHNLTLVACHLIP